MPATKLILAREENILRVNFNREPEEPTPPFSGGVAIRARPPTTELAEVVGKAIKMSEAIR